MTDCKKCKDCKYYDNHLGYDTDKYCNNDIICSMRSNILDAIGGRYSIEDGNYLCICIGPDFGCKYWEAK